MVEELSKNNNSTALKPEKNKTNIQDPVKISAKILSPLMPTITPTLIENK